MYGFSVDTSFSPGERLNRLVPPGVLLVFRVPFGVRDDHLLRAPSRECDLLPVSGDLCVVCAGIAVVLEELLWSAALSFLILSFLSLPKKTLCRTTIYTSSACGSRSYRSMSYLKHGTSLT